MAERTPNYAFSVKTSKAKELSLLRERMKDLKTALAEVFPVKLPPNIDNMRPTEQAWRRRYAERILPISIGQITLIARLSKDSPHYSKYKKMREEVRKNNDKLYKSSRRLQRKRGTRLIVNPKIAPEHVSHYDVYVRGTPILAGYTPSEVRGRKPRYDQEKRLHSEKGPALAINGYAFYFWHGTQIPPAFIKRKSMLTAAYIFKIENAETRRIAIEIVGWDKLVEDLSPVTLNKHKDPKVGTLIEVTLPIRDDRDSRGRRRMPFDDDWVNDEATTRTFDRRFLRQRLLRVQCGTGRYFSIPVIDTVNTAMEAQAWMWGMDPKTFKMPEVRT